MDVTAPASPSSIVSLVIATGVISALANASLTWVREWLTKRSERKAEARYAVVRMAVLLEGYANSCLGFWLAAEADLKQGAQAIISPLPTLEEYPTDIEWKNLDPRTLNDFLSFKNEV